MLTDFHKATILFNPASGPRHRERSGELQQAARILTAAGIETEIILTEARGAATRQAREAVERGADLVIPCGGDGTINEVVNGLAGTSVPLGILPAGTANVLAKELGIPRDIPTAARLIPSGSLRRIALGLARPLSQANGFHERYFLCLAGAGPDGELVRLLEDKLKEQTGILAYWLEGFRQLFRYKFPLFRVSSSGKDVDASLVVVGRTKCYGGPFRITTRADLFEDSFELMTLSSRSALRYVAFLPALLRERLRGKPGVNYWKATQVLCAAPEAGPVYAQVDGEPVGPLPFEFRIVPDALTLVVPQPAVREK
jgi:diacylglycerol kinase (ATP)